MRFTLDELLTRSEKARRISEKLLAQSYVVQQRSWRLLQESRDLQNVSDRRIHPPR